MNTSKRPTAPRQAKPAQRYFPGKAPKGAAAVSDSDASSDEDVHEAQLDEGDVPLGGDQLISGDEEDEGAGDTTTRHLSTATPAGVSAKIMNVSLQNVNITDGKVIVDGRAESGRTEMEVSSAEEEEEGAAPSRPADATAEEEQESSSEYETEDEKPVPLFRPVFVPKRARVTVHEREAESQNTEEAQAKREAEAEKRQKESHDLVAESIKRELAEKEVQEVIPDVDDTDGIDPSAEFEEWRLRELSRIKRDKEAQLKREEEREEIERRRALPEEQRLAEDLEHAKKSRDEKPKGKQQFLQKYYHKGAFHQDAEVLQRRDYTEATESTVDISLLPKVMQVRNFGKRSQTKYTHLLDQDTTREAKPPWMQGRGPGRNETHHDKRASRRERPRSQSPRRRGPPPDNPRHHSSYRRPRSPSPSLDRYDKRRRRD